jgi:hypothetical protein
MISKERLLAGLNEFVNVEEGVITIYANFSKALLKSTPAIKKDKKEKIVKLLSTLYRDSVRHKELIDKMIKGVTGSEKDEY